MIKAIFDHIQKYIQPFLKLIQVINKNNLSLIPVGIFAYQNIFVNLISSFVSLGKNSENLIKLIFQVLTLISVIIFFTWKTKNAKWTSQLEITQPYLKDTSTITPLEKIYIEYFQTFMNLCNVLMTKTGLIGIIIIVGNISKHFQIILGQKIANSDIPVSKFMMFTHFVGLALLSLYLSSGAFFIHQSIRDKKPLNILLYRIIAQHLHIFLNLIGAIVYIIALFFNGIIDSSYFTCFSRNNNILNASLDWQSLGWTLLQISSFSKAVYGFFWFYDKKEQLQYKDQNNKLKGESIVIFCVIGIYTAVLCSKSIAPVSNNQYSILDFIRIVLWDSFVGSEVAYSYIYPLLFNIDIPESYETETDLDSSNNMLPISKMHMSIFRSTKLFVNNWQHYVQLLKSKMPTIYGFFSYINQNITSVIFYFNVLAIFNFVPTQIIVNGYTIFMFLPFILSSLILYLDIYNNMIISTQIYCCLPLLLQMLYLIQNLISGYFINLI